MPWKIKIEEKKSIDVEFLPTFLKHISKIRFFETHGNSALILSVNVILISSRFCLPTFTQSHLFLTNRVSSRSKHCIVDSLSSIVVNTGKIWKVLVHVHTSIWILFYSLSYVIYFIYINTLKKLPIHFLLNTKTSTKLHFRINQ